MFSKCFTFLLFYGIFVRKEREIFTHHYTDVCVDTKMKRRMNWLSPNLKDKWLSWIRIQVGIPDHLTCLLRNLYAGQEARVRIGRGTTDWFQTGRGVHQGCILSPYLFNLYTEYIMRNTRLDEVQAGIKTARRNINNLRYADDTTLMAESEEELKSLLMKVKEESEKVGLKVNIQKAKIMTSGPITSWQIDGETVETVADFYFFGLQNHCRWRLQP